MALLKRRRGGPSLFECLQKPGRFTPVFQVLPGEQPIETSQLGNDGLMSLCFEQLFAESRPHPPVLLGTDLIRFSLAWRSPPAGRRTLR